MKKTTAQIQKDAERGKDVYCPRCDGVMTGGAGIL